MQIKKILYSSLAAVLLSTGAYFGIDYAIDNSKKYIDNKVKTEIVEYDQKVDTKLSKSENMLDSRIDDQNKEFLKILDEKDKEYDANINIKLERYDKKAVSRLDSKISQYEEEDQKRLDSVISENNKKINNLDSKIIDYHKKAIQSMDERIIRYDEKASERLDNKITEYDKKNIKNIDSKIKEYAQIIESKFDIKVDQAQMDNAYESAYFLMNDIYYVSENGLNFTNKQAIGSGILLEGGYMLTAKHLTDPGPMEHPFLGTYDPVLNDMFILDGWGTDDPKKYRIEKIISGDDLNSDYALLKIVRDDLDLTHYKNGLNFPEDIKLGDKSITIGNPLGTGKHIRYGNVSQTKSSFGKNLLTMKANSYPGDSGGPVFIVKDGKLRLSALTTSGLMYTIFQGLKSPTCIGNGYMISRLVEDLEKKLESEDVSDDAKEDIRNFLRLNKK